LPNIKFGQTASFFPGAVLFRPKIHDLIVTDTSDFGWKFSKIKGYGKSGKCGKVKKVKTNEK